MSTDTLWLIGLTVVICLYVLKRLYNHLLGDDPVCGDHSGAGLCCTLSVDHYGDHRYHNPGTGRGDDKTWTWPRREPVPALLPPTNEAANYLCARTAHEIATRIAQDRSESTELKDYRQGMMRAEEIAARVAREWENR